MVMAKCLEMLCTADGQRLIRLCAPCGSLGLGANSPGDLCQRLLVDGRVYQGQAPTPQRRIET